MGDRFYTEGDALYLDEQDEDFEFMEGDTDDEGGLLDQNSKTGDPRERVHTQEENNDEDYFDINNYKGIYFNEGVGEGEKNHWDITGAHFRYEDAVGKLIRLKEKQTKREDTKSQLGKVSPLKIENKPNRTNNNVAKVKIILNYNKQKGNLSNDK